ncbi:unnamed protein product [Ambrosiozyma monospora]|uniref:Unnamed protein product n=1 Tax=Ambrosiozyma monospora TaxID=43982 RepID=A0ACB5T860_AMBMO|nr:unnamed protein product [Ambrosiozyma monospora]
MLVYTKPQSNHQLLPIVASCNSDPVLITVGIDVTVSSVEVTPPPPLPQDKSQVDSVMKMELPSITGVLLLLLLLLCGNLESVEELRLSWVYHYCFEMNQIAPAMSFCVVANDVIEPWLIDGNYGFFFANSS